MNKNSMRSYLEQEIENCKTDGYAQLLTLPLTREEGSWQLEVCNGIYTLMIDICSDLYFHKDFYNMDELVDHCMCIYNGSISPTVC